MMSLYNASKSSTYDYPRLIHQARVRKIFEVPSLKDNSGEELRYLHNVLQEHLHARKS